MIAMHFCSDSNKDIEGCCSIIEDEKKKRIIQIQMEDDVQESKSFYSVNMKENILFNFKSEIEENNFDVDVKVERVELEDFEIEQYKPEDLILSGRKKDCKTPRANLYKYHIIKEELVIGPEVIQKTINDTTVITKKDPKDTSESKLKYSCLKKTLKKSHIKTNRCEICDKILSSSGNLTRHLKSVHAGLCPHVCHTCGARYKRKELLKNHIGKKHQQNTQRNKKTAVCIYCNDIFADRRGRDRHVQFHCVLNANKQTKQTKLFNFICDLCEKSYTRKDSLEKHIRNHFGMSIVFQCNDCDKKYTKKLNLKYHIQTRHLKKKGYSCKKCKKTFYSRWGMLTHESRHSNIIK